MKEPCQKCRLARLGKIEYTSLKAKVLFPTADGKSTFYFFPKPANPKKSVTTLLKNENLLQKGDGKEKLKHSSQLSKAGKTITKLQQSKQKRRYFVQYALKSAKTLVKL